MIKRTLTYLGASVFLLTALPAAAGPTPAEEGAVNPAKEDADVVATPEQAAAGTGLTAGPIVIHGFVSQGYMKSTANNYLALTQRGAFDFTELGTNFSSQLTDDLRVALQLFSYNFGNTGKFVVNFDWAYLSYHYADWLGIRAGKFKVPDGLYTEILDTDAARVPILLPPGVYDPALRLLTTSLCGADVFGAIGLGPVGALDYEIFGGTQKGAVPDYDLHWFYKAGGTLAWRTPVPGLKLMGTAYRQSFNATKQLDTFTTVQLQMAGVEPEGFDGKIVVRSPAWLNWTASAEYTNDDLLLAAEYTRRTTHYTSNHPEIAPVSDDRQDAWYGLASYRFAPWIALSAYYSVFTPNIDDRNGEQMDRPSRAFQRDAALSVRFDINDYWLVKLEGHYMDGIAGLSPMGGGSLQADMNAAKDQWGLFLAKTTVAF